MGSIIGAYMCCKPIEQLMKTLEIDTYLDKPLLKFKANSLWDLVSALSKGQPVLDTNHIKTTVRRAIGDVTFKEVHD